MCAGAAVFVGCIMLATGSLGVIGGLALAIVLGTASGFAMNKTLKFGAKSVYDFSLKRDKNNEIFKSSLSKSRNLRRLAHKKNIVTTTSTLTYAYKVGNAMGTSGSIVVRRPSTVVLASKETGAKSTSVRQKI